ncbi:MAG: hypothetical protein FWC93_07515 [Defluviitaleaceae bacterium]|nr:hypothetical protein [Defluviitaleaceae bacterium]
MEPEVIVYDEKGDAVGKTFGRRARQLVAKGRARWVDETQGAVVLVDGDGGDGIYSKLS